MRKQKIQEKIEKVVDKVERSALKKINKNDYVLDSDDDHDSFDLDA